MRLRRHFQEISVRARLNMFSVYGRLAEWMIALVLKTSERDERSTGSNPVPSAKKRMFTNTFGTQLSTPQHFLKQCDIYIKNNNLK